MSHPRLASGVVQIIRDRPLTSFFVLTYAISWLLWTPVLILGVPVFSATTHTPSLWVLPGIAFGVTGSAFAVTAVTQGRPGVQQLLRRLVLWRVGWRWYAVAVLLIPVSEVAVAAALGGPDALRARHRHLSAGPRRSGNHLRGLRRLRSAVRRADRVRAVGAGADGRDPRATGHVRMTHGPDPAVPHRRRRR